MGEMTPIGAYLRALWAAAAIGVAAGVATSARTVGDLPPLSVLAAAALPAAVFGLLGVALGAAILAVSALHRPWARVAVAVAGGGGLAFVAPTVVWGPPATSALALGFGCLVGAAQSGLAETLLRRERVRTRTGGVREIDGVGIAASLVGGLVGLMLAGATVGFLREGLRYGCDYILEGEGAGSWLCQDGIGYLGAGIPLVGIALLTAAAGATVSAARGPVRARVALLLAIAAVPPVGFGASTFYAVTVLGRTLPPGQHPLDAWWTLVVPCVVATLLAVAAVGAGIVVGRRRPRVGAIVVAAGFGLFVVAGVLQPGALVLIAPAAGVAVAYCSSALRLSAHAPRAIATPTTAA
jgi:hypothetical protein